MMKYKKLVKIAKDRLIYGCDLETFAYLKPGKFMTEENDAIRLNLLISTADKQKMYGGLSTAYRFFDCLKNVCGFDSRIVITNDAIKADILEQYDGYVLVNGISDVKHQMFDFSKRNTEACVLPVRPRDVFISTYWSTVYIAKHIRDFQNTIYSKSNPLIYLIQDYEPGFYKWSSEYMLVESTYHMENTIAVINSENLYDYFNRLGYKFSGSFYFEPRINELLKKSLLENYHDNNVRKKQLIIYGRPFNGRNCFSLIVASLKYLLIEHQDLLELDWKFISIGAHHKDIKIAKNTYLKCKGKLSLDEYARVLLESKVGISLMCSPHPSYPPLEMASFGVKTVTNNFVCKELSGFNSNILSVQAPTVESLADAIYKQMKSEDGCIGCIHLNSEYLNTDNQFGRISQEIKNMLFQEKTV